VCIIVFDDFWLHIPFKNDKKKIETSTYCHLFWLQSSMVVNALQEAPYTSKVHEIKT
jgi:hypothetical protein